MVKRAKTPEANEEAKYYTCWSPYPNNADFELSNDYITFCRWIANILDNSSALHSLYYKPRHGMVIFAVDKTYPRPERLLGEHRWSEFLKKPKQNERTLLSKIFYSTYSTDREVQKDGWKCIFVEDYFFLNWGIDKWFTRVPYPTPHWCDVPSENRVHKALCRPLPGAQVPRPGPSSQPIRTVVGSADWAQTRASTTSRRATPKASGNAASTDKGGKTNKQTTKPALGQDSFPALDSKAVPKKTIPGLSIPSAPPTQSAWGNRPSGSVPAPLSPHRSALSPPANSTAHQVWATVKPSTTRPSPSPSTSTSSPSGSGNIPPAKMQGEKSKAAPKPDPVATTKQNNKGKAKYSGSESSSSQTEHSNTVSPPSSAPSSPSLSVVSLASGSVSGSVQVDPSQYDEDDDYDEELTEETYHESWETASMYEPNENTIAVRIGSNDKGKVTSAPPVTISKANIGATSPWPEDNPKPSTSAPVKARSKPVKQEPEINLWADVKPNLRPTGRASAMEARAKTENEVLCPLHKGKCPRGVCEEYKKEKKRVDKLERKKKREEEKEEEKRKAEAEEKEEEKEKAKAKEEGNEGEKKETKEKSRPEREEPKESKKESKKKKAKEDRKPVEKKEMKEKYQQVDQERASREKEPKEESKKVDGETSMKDAPTPSPSASNQENKKMWADYDVDDDDSDIGDLPDFGNVKMFYGDEDFERHED